MKLHLFLLMLPLLLLACKETPQNPTNSKPDKTETTEQNKTPRSDFIISESRVGTFAIGGEIPATSDVYRLQKTKKNRETEGGPVMETHYLFSKDQTVQLVLKPRDGVDKLIGEIMVLSNRYRTKEGIGVNSTLKEFQKAYPNFNLWYTYVSDRYVLENTNSSIQFLLDEKDFIGEMEVNSVKVPLKPSDFKEGAKIVKIRVYK